jgi:hypothetical protein
MLQKNKIKDQTCNFALDLLYCSCNVMVGHRPKVGISKYWPLLIALIQSHNIIF